MLKQKFLLFFLVLFFGCQKKSDTFDFVFDSKREIANIGILASLSFTKTGIKATHYEYEIKRCSPIIKKKTCQNVRF